MRVEMLSLSRWILTRSRWWVPVLGLAAQIFAVQAQVFLAEDGVTHETCYGTFHDSGGPTAGYSNNEDLVTVVCPTGGPAAGPTTSILFTQWELAAGPGDSLWVYSGTSTSGSLLVLAGSGTPLLGQAFSSSDASGCLTFRWRSDGTANAAGWTARITTGPEAGEDASLGVCSSDPAVNLFDVLGGAPQPGGTWTDPLGAAFSGTFVPATDAPGIHTYTLPAPNPCPAATATVTMAVVPARDPGSDASTTVCSNGVPFAMRSRLGGTPQPGGTWTDPNGDPHPSTFDPAGDIPGNYIYRLVGTAPCSDTTAVLTVSVQAEPVAGSDALVTVCNDEGPVDLFDVLGGTPQPGGTWQGPAGAFSGVFDPAVDVPGDHVYTVAGTPPCTDGQATVTVVVNPRPDAGEDGTVTICSNDAPFGLFDALGGTPEAGGSWTGPNGLSVAGTYTPGLSTPGQYTYTVLGLPPCQPSSSIVNVVQVAAPDPGTSASVTVCSNDAAFDMLGLLGGTPQPGGSWAGPNGPHGNLFDPAQDTPGAYVYTVPGAPPCADASATLTITVRPAPDAGLDASITVCSTDANLQLLDALDGTPQAGGSWTGPNGQPHPGMFMPATSEPGIYTYTVVGQAPCAPAVATVTVTVNTAPSAGVNASLLVCSNDAPLALFDQLGGAPDAGGSWQGPAGPHGPDLDPGVDLPGPYTYTVAGLTPCADASAVVNVSVTPAPDAGLDGDTTLCSNNAPFDLITRLGGDPDLNGEWIAPDGSPHSGVFVPGSDDAGVYRYRVPGVVPCADDEAEVTVTVVEAPDPGSNGSITLCSDTSAVDLFALLGGSPQPGGAWTRPNGTAHPGVYLPSSEPGGTYTYTVQGQTPCLALSAAVQVTRVIAPNAGTNSSTTVCSTNGPFALLSVLGGDPSGSGSWLDPAQQAFPGTFVPGSSAPGQYTYVVPGITPCANDTARLNVVVNTAPDAGNNATITVCDTNAPFALLGQLGGTPDANGTWTAPDASPSDGTYVPGTSLPGGYTYVVPGIAPCLNATTVLVVNENRQPLAGTSVSIERCSTDGVVDLFLELGGSPDPGGQWTGPSGASSGLFDPATGTPGDHVYTLVGASPCVNASATVSITVNQAPDAGTSGEISVCTDQSVVDLFDGLGGAPDPNGIWADVSGTGQQSGQFFSPIGLPAGSYPFTYTVEGIGLCGDAVSTVTVNLVGLLDAGSNGTVAACATNTQVNLFSGLGGSPQSGGQWIDLDATGAVTNQFFNAALVGPGTYQFRYLLTGTVGCASDSAVATVNVVAAPNAGNNASTATCSNSPAFSLFPVLGGNPQSGGNWTFNEQPFSGVYDPVLNGSGVYRYTVSGTAPCANATATVTVTEVPAPNAGVSGVTTVCSNGGPFNMTSQLGGTPQAGGAWSFGGQSHGNIYVPGLDEPGIYVYTVAGLPPCNPSQATLTVTQVPAPNAGNNSSVTVCSTSLPLVLNTFLGPGAQTGGTWVGPAGPSDGVYVPGTSAPGDYFYTVPGIAPCDPDVAVVSVFENQAANAGGSAAITLCQGGGSVNLLSVLSGSPDPTGTWTGPSPSTDPFSGVFVPGTTPPGVYTYFVPGAPPCPNRTSTVTVAVNAPPNAGCSNAISVCSTDAPFSMVGRLACPPNGVGVWTGPAPATTTMDGLFFPGQTAPGLYTYTVPGTAPCANATATLSITVTQAANAGQDASINLCTTGGATDLFPLLGPSAQVGGTWTDPNNQVHSGTFLPGTDVPGTYRYTVAGQGTCTSDFALVSVVVNIAPNAGCNGLVTICDSDSPFQLFNFLGCAPNSGGVWTDPTGVPHSGIYLPGTDEPGVYTYTITGQSPCNNSVARVTVIENQEPNAGSNGFLTVCTDQAAVNLFGSLGGSPDNGGSWIDPVGEAFSGTYVPGSSQPGAYTYRLNALAPCEADSAVVTVVQNQAPNAGQSTVAFVCSDTLAFALIDLLGGTPDAGGSWTLGGQLRSPIFNPSVDGTGTYVYTVNGVAPCSNASAQVQLTRVLAPSAGVGGTIAACIDDPAIALVTGITGPFTPGGSWNDDDGTGQLSGTVFNATDLPAGTYRFTYTVPGIGPCNSRSTTVTVVVSEALDAGQDAAVSVCESEIVELFPLLGGQPQPGGQWQDVDNSGALLGGGVFNASLVQNGSTWRFRYVLPASAQCPSDTATVTATVVEGPFAGCDGALSLCTTNLPTNLINALTCGPDAGGSWLDPTNAPHPGVFVPATDVPGVYRYVVPGVGACPGDTANVIVQLTQAVNAGVNANLAICSSDAPTNLFPLLGPDAQTGGGWRFNGDPHPGIYNPAIDAPGVYTYRVTGTPPCSDDLATVTVSEPQAPNAGCNATVSLCSNQAPINMRLSLGCAPQAGGSWVGPDGPHGQFFDPASDAPGTYIYTVNGVAPCSDASATLVVGVTQQPDPGQDANLTACLGQAPFDLFDALGPLAQPGGNWTDVGGSGALAGSVFDPAQAGVGQWVFTYGFASNGPCPATSRQVTVNVVLGPSAGEGASITVCGADESFPLITGLGGDPDPGGTWTDQQGTGALVAGGLLNATLLPVGTTAGFTYTVEDAACGSVSATVVVTVADFPDPGVGVVIVRCISDAPLDLFGQLQGTPDVIGLWTGPDGEPHGTTFTPGTDVAGPYTYTVQGDGVCPDSSAVIDVQIDLPPDPGISSSVLACDTLQALDLLAQLGGSPDPGGIWTAVPPVPGTGSGVVATSGLEPGAYTFTHTVSNVGCGTAASQVVLEVVGAVQVRDVVRECNEQDRTYVVSFLIEEGDAATYAVSGLEGTLVPGSPSIFTSEPIFTSDGFEAFVSDQYACAVQVVTGESPCVFDDEVFLPEAFSPNGDGINDSFVIPGIEGYPGNSLLIFNRWGARMFQGEGYDNRSVVWDGTSPEGLYDGQAPAGTYYYILDLGAGGDPITGYIYLNR